MSGIKISVIVPIYKIENYLPQCIDSLLEQSFLDFELILVNDGSPDGCPKICDDYAKLDHRVKVVHKENGGLLSARKAGLKAASGEYIAYVDGDDWVDHYYLDILYKLAKTNSADLVSTGHFREFNGKIETIKPLYFGNFNAHDIKHSILPNAIYNGEFCKHGISTYVWNKLFRKDILSKVLFDVPNEIVMGEDAAITYSYLAMCKRLVKSDIPLYYYRQRHDSIVKSIENPKIEYYRLGLLMHFLKTKLSPVMDKETLDRQLTYYLYSQILVRSGGLITNAIEGQVFNPFLKVKKDSRVVVYSSGSFGQHILSTNENTSFFKIIKWIDIDYHDLKIGKNSVKPISSVNNDEFDFLIIATINPTAYGRIKSELQLMGIDEAKIAEIDTDETQIKTLIKAIGFDNDFKFQNT
ncbi:MAG: glycosyltransferase family 2 protein [Winogradskyella sp.]|uniref:glycosyltransferase family 2 protein n=1 Tax=Winogradskyella sp. TaxID=1883156 RepID=UPI003858F187